MLCEVIGDGGTLFHQEDGTAETIIYVLHRVFKTVTKS